MILLLLIVAEFMNQIDSLQKQLNYAQKRLNKLECASRNPIPSKELQQESITELSIALEELNVAVEELEIQNQTLLATQESLEWERQRYQNLFEFAPDAYIVTDNNLIIQEVNTVATTLFNLPAKYLQGKPLDIFISSTDYSVFHHQWVKIKKILGHKFQNSSLQEAENDERKRQLQNLPLSNWEIQLQSRDSKPVSVLISVSCLCDDRGNISNFHWLMRDLTTRKKAEQTYRELEREKALRKLQNRLFSLASHELRTPITVVLSSVQNLLTFSEEWTEEKKLKKLRNIEFTAHNMRSLLDEVMLVNRVELEMRELQTTYFNLENFCQELIQNMSLNLKEKQQLNFVSQGNCQEILLDQKLLTYILSNLLSNAIKYSPEEAEIELIVIEEDKEIILQVKDQGIGIPENDKPHVFEEFYRGENVSNISGLGLGLSLIKKCVELHNGSISFVSEQGKGTTFTVKLKQG